MLSQFLHCVQMVAFTRLSSMLPVNRLSFRFILRGWFLLPEISSMRVFVPVPAAIHVYICSSYSLRYQSPSSSPYLNTYINVFFHIMKFFTRLFYKLPFTQIWRFFHLINVFTYFLTVCKIFVFLKK